MSFGLMIRSCTGAMLVFYNTTVIAYSLPFLSNALFSSAGRVQGALNVLALMAAGYAAKPIAQAIGGSYADRIGRKPLLVFASAATVATSALLAILPPASSIGIAAPVLFTVLTAAQAAIAGAEWPLLAAYIAESSKPRKRALLTSVASFSVCLGWLLAILVPLALHGALDAAHYALWGWRVAFLPAIILGLLSVALRRTLPESPLFVQLRNDTQLSAFPLKDLFSHQSGTWALLTVHVGAISAAFFLTVSYPVVFVALSDKFSHVESLIVGACGLAGLCAVICAGGWLADRFGPRMVGGTGFALIAALAYPAYTLMSQGRLAGAVAGAILLGAPLGLAAGVYEAWTVSAFRVRYTGAALTCNGVAVGLFGTTVLWLAAHLTQNYGYMSAAILPIIAGIVGFITTRLLPPSVHNDLQVA